jgi:hypothetical protein
MSPSVRATQALLVIAIRMSGLSVIFYIATPLLVVSESATVVQLVLSAPVGEF